MTATALPRAAVAPVFAAALGLATLGATAAPAAADPGTPPVLAAPAAPAFPEDDVTDDGRPVRIEVSRFEPRTITPGSLVTVTGTLTNTGPTPITDLSIRLQRGAALTTRADLAADALDPGPMSTVLAPFQEVGNELGPGDELEFSYTVPSEDLQLTEDGVYPALLNVNGAVDGVQRRRVAELSTYIIQQPQAPAARTAVAWLWPLTEPSHRTASGGFRDDGLAESISDGGRLDRALGVIERLPGGQAGNGTEVAPTLRVALAVDPALVEEVQLMAAGPYQVDGREGEGTEEAAAFLERLAAVATVHPVVALPYGDVDGDAVTGAGIPDVLTRSLPGTPEGTAQDPPESTTTEDGAAASATTAPPSPAAPGAEQPDTSAGVAILSEALGVEPRGDLAWAPGATVRPETLPVLQAGGVTQVVVSATGLTGGEDATGLADPTATARTTVATASGPLDALVADPTLSALVGAAEEAAGGARMAEQRYLAELAVLTTQAPEGTEQTVLVAPPREVDAGPEGAGAMMADTATLPWLRPATVAELAASAPATAGGLTDATDALSLDPAGLAHLTAAVATREDLAGAVVGDDATALRSYDAAISRAASATRRDDPEEFREVTAALESTLGQVRSEVTLLEPADGTYSLGSSDASLVLTAQNDLPVAVEVLVDVRALGSRGITIHDIGLRTLAPNQITTLQIPTEVRQTGGFAVTARLTTPGGRPLGEAIQLQVKSTAYGSISLIITIGAGALLALLFLRRLVRFVLRRRRAAADGAPSAATEGAALQSPPNRSPV